MTFRNTLPTLAVFALAAVLAVVAARVSVSEIERRSVRDVDAALEVAGLTWPAVSSDGLRVNLSGTAPDEATRFRALRIAGTIVEGTRIVDAMEVAESTPATPPRFSIELLRTDDQITMIGLVPDDIDREALIRGVSARTTDLPVTDLLETADYPVPDTWARALDFGLYALGRFDQAKVSISPGRIQIETMAENAEARAQLQREVMSRAPSGLDVALDIAAPRPVIAPFTLRLLKRGGETSFDACAAETAQSAQAILSAARAIGAPESAGCTNALGAPSGTWTEAAVAGIRALGPLSDATLTISDLDVRLDAADGTDAEAFDTAAATLRTDLPQEYTLAVQSPSDEPAGDAGPAEFIATRSPEGQVALRGRTPNQRSLVATEAFARALFGSDSVSSSLDVMAEVPEGWSPQVLAALDALSALNHGAAVLQPGSLSVRGVSGNSGARAGIAGLLSQRLGGDASYEIDVDYDERLDPVAGLPSPEECVAQANAILQDRQITFAPGAAEIEPGARDSVDAVSEILIKCEGVPIEVGGFTDSQGRDEMNQRLSQNRAEAVIDALLGRRVAVSAMTAVGYGEENPIADNATADGREANRRIEFALRPGAAPEAPETPEDDAPAAQLGDAE